MCFEQWCRFCGSTLFVFWRNVLHCSRMCLYVEAFVWYNVFLVPCFFRFVFGSIDVMFWGRGRPYTATELCLFILFCTMFVWCRVCSAVFVGQRMLCFEGETFYTAAKYVCLLKLFWYRVCLTPFLFGVVLFGAVLVWFAVFVPMCLWVNGCYVLRERETLYCCRTVCPLASRTWKQYWWKGQRERKNIGEKDQTWNLSKNLHRRIFRLKILHRQFHLISTV